MGAQEEKRRTPRIQPFVAPCRYVLGGKRVAGFITDISERGGRIHSDVEPPAVGAALTLEARLGRHATHLRIPATVRWSRPSPRGGFLFGLSFDGIAAETQHALEGVVDEFRRRAASIE
jgi:PilZ domain